MYQQAYCNYTNITVAVNRIQGLNNDVIHQRGGAMHLDPDRNLVT